MLAWCAPQHTDVDNSVIGPDEGAEPATDEVEVNENELGAEPPTVEVEVNGNGLGAEPATDEVEVNENELGAEPATDEVEVNGNELGAQPATDEVEVNGNDFADLAVNDNMFEAVPDDVWPESFGPQLRPPTLEKPVAGVRQKKRRREAGELVSKKDRKGKAYKGVRRTGEKQKCSVGTQCNGASSSTPLATTSVQGTPAEPVPMPMETPTVRITRSKLRVNRGGHTG
ncbi:hypothetical protein LINPERHAP1_LOCUS31447 [Linum perenne]